MAKADRSQPVVASGGSDAAITPTADDRYLALLERVSDRLGDEGPELVLELDRCVSERLAAAQDGALDSLVIGLRTECSPGVARWVTTADKGYDPIRQHEAEEAFLGRLRDELDAKSADVAYSGDCGCEFKDLDWHDELLALYGDGDVLAFVSGILDEYHRPSWGEVASMIRQHNWPDPVGMGLLSEQLRHYDWPAVGAFQWRPEGAAQPVKEGESLA